MNSVEDSYNTSPSNNCSSIGCNSNLSSTDPASLYQKQKLIWNTVRVPASLYLQDLGALTVYQKPNPLRGVNWNQMSDRSERHVQPNIVAGGSGYHSSSTKHTITRPRPGAGCPGGSGVDIKHNSYDRYLRRLIGKGPARQGAVPPNFGKPVKFNPAFPIYGGKTFKTNIVSSNYCNCPIGSKQTGIYDVYTEPFIQSNIAPIFKVGDKVYAQNVNYHYQHAVILSLENGVFSVLFDDGTIAKETVQTMVPYYGKGTNSGPCNKCHNEKVPNPIPPQQNIGVYQFGYNLEEDPYFIYG
jgi:hypothetical protein